jgi:hypothetical protein
VGFRRRAMPTSLPQRNSGSLNSTIAGRTTPV